MRTAFPVHFAVKRQEEKKDEFKKAIFLRLNKLWINHRSKWSPKKQPHNSTIVKYKKHFTLYRKKPELQLKNACVYCFSRILRNWTMGWRNVNCQNCKTCCQIILLKNCTIYTSTPNVRTLIFPTFTNADCH